jgi:hypothetical protein
MAHVFVLEPSQYVVGSTRSTWSVDYSDHY